MKRKVLIGGSIGILAAGCAVWLLLSGGNTPKNISLYWNGTGEINTADKSGHLPLVLATAAKDGTAVKYLLEQGANPDKTDNSGATALEIAAAVGDSQLFELLAASSQTDFKAPKLLDRALDGGNPAVIRQLINKGNNVNAMLTFRGKRLPTEEIDYHDPRVVTPLKKAVAMERADIVTLLLDSGAEGAEFMLTENIRQAKPDIIRALGDKVENISDVQVKNRDLLTYAVDKAPLETLSYLIEKNSGDVNKALRRLLTYRVDMDDAEAVAEAEKRLKPVAELLLQSGARPTPEFMEMLLTKKRGDVYLTMAQCSAQPNAVTAKGESLLMFALSHGYTDGVRYLLEHNADIWLKEKDGRIPLYEMVTNADKYPELLQLAEAYLPSVNDSGYNGETLLMLYAAAGNKNAFERLVQKGADIFKIDNAGKNLLMYAAEGGNSDIVRSLISSGMVVSAKDNAGRTALMYAAAKGKTEIAEILMSNGAKTSDADYEGKNVLMYAAEGGMAELAVNLLSRGESAAEFDNAGRTPLMYAALAGRKNMVKELVSRGADVAKTDINGRTVLSYAAENGNAEIIKFVRESGSDAYLMDNDNRRPVDYAAEQGNYDAFLLLTDNFMNFGNTMKSTGKTTLMHAIEGGNVKIMRHIFSGGATSYNKKDCDGRTALMYLVGGSRPDMVREFLYKGANPAARDNAGKTVLMYAAEGGISVNLLSVLNSYDEYASKHMNMRDNEGRNALMYAVSGKNGQLIKLHLLLGRGLNSDVTDNAGKTLLMYALENSDIFAEPKMIEEILSVTKKIEQNDDKGRTALMYAALNPQVDSIVFKMLLKAGANPLAADNSGKTVLMYAAEGGDITKYRMLLAAGAKADGASQNGKTVVDYAAENGSCFLNGIKK